MVWHGTVTVLMCDVWSLMVLHSDPMVRTGPLLRHMVRYGLQGSTIVLYGLENSCMVCYCPVWSHMVPNGPI